MTRLMTTRIQLVHNDWHICDHTCEEVEHDALVAHELLEEVEQLRSLRNIYRAAFHSTLRGAAMVLNELPQEEGQKMWALLADKMAEATE